MSQNTDELRLEFERAGDQFSLRVERPGTDPKAKLTFDPFLSEDDYEDLRWYLEDYMDLPDGGSVVGAQRIERSLEEWGQKLYADVFDDAVSRQLLTALMADHTHRLLTIATNEPDVLRLPWELMADSRGPLTQQGLTIRRQLELTQEPTEYQATLPLRILLVVSRPDDTGFIDPRHTARAMLDALAPLGDRVAVDFCRPPTLATMQQMLSAATRRSQPYHIVHFCGHGDFIPEISLGALCFEKPEGGAGLVETDHVRADRLGDLLARHKIPLAVLEACRSGQMDRVLAFRSIAPRLIHAGVGSVLSMSHAVHVEATRTLLERFYQQLVGGVSIGQALEEARAALIAYPYRWIEPGPRGQSVELKDWFLPHLYQQGDDTRLVPKERAVESSALLAPIPEADREIQFDAFLSHNHADSARVEALATQLQDRFGLRIFLDKWYIKTGPIHDQCEKGIALSRFVLVVCSKDALESDWVTAELDLARAIDPRGRNIVPVVLEDVDLPLGLKTLCKYDFHNPTQDEANLTTLAHAIQPPPAQAVAPKTEDRQPTTEPSAVGAFPRAPLYHFHGRARELHALEREFRSFRAVLLHAMGGMGKTALAREAAFWWTRTGLFPDGACFLSFERGRGADQIALTLGTYLEGHEFERRPAEEQRVRARELFQSKSVLMVWDNFESVLPAFQADEPAPVVADEERARILELFQDWTESADGHGRLLITCRPAEAGLTAARKMELRGLARPDSLSLLARVMKTQGVELSDERLSKGKLDELLGTLADHPLSIELVGPHLAKMTPDAIVSDFGKLLDEFKRGKGQERNESLLASLAFSTRRLSKAAQKALPWLGLFSGGVFEHNLLDVSQMNPEVWESVRAELEATALVRVERECQLTDRPYLRFHPTLTYAAQLGQLPDLEAGRKRFVEVYLSVRAAIHSALGGSNPRGGMEVMAREEPNFRNAVRLAAGAQAYDEASAMGDTFRRYLQRSGRLRERDSWVKWLAAEVAKGGFSKAAAGRERDEAWSLFTQGQFPQAVEMLQSLIQRLKTTTEFDPAFQLALAVGDLGKIYYSAGLAEQAIPILEDAIDQCEALVKKEEDAGRSSETERGNLSATLGDLANALRGAGRLDEAMEAAQRGIEIDRELGHEREAAAGLIQTAQILMGQGRYGEADDRYGDALRVARQVGDKELEGTTLQNQGSLADHMRQYDRAAALYQRALKLFQDANDEEGVMQTCNLLGEVERKQGRLSEAREWYERSREIAARRGDKDSLGAAAQNIGIVCQQEGQAAREAGDEATAVERFQQAAASVAESLNAWLELKNRPYEAMSHGQLARICLLLGHLDEAEEHAAQGLAIDEELQIVRELPTDYQIMRAIARARGNEAEAAEWERKRDVAIAELERRAQGEGGTSQQLVKAILALAMDCARAGVDGSDLNPQAESVIAKLEQADPPLNSLSPFLRTLAAGQLPSVPPGLPEELSKMLAELMDAVREAQGS